MTFRYPLVLNGTQIQELQAADALLLPVIKTQSIIEPITIVSSAATGTINFDCATSSEVLYTANASGNFTLNLRASSALSLNNYLAIGESVCVSFLNTNGATAYYNSLVQVDGATVTPKWQGSAPTSGNASAIDVYTYAIIKTANATFTVLAGQTKFA